MSQTLTLSNSTVSNFRTPEKRRAYNIPLSSADQITVAIDLKSLINLRRIDFVQGLFIDNSAAVAPITVSTAAGFNLDIQEGWQAMVPLYMNADNVLIVSFKGNVNILLTNFIVPAAQWPAASPNAFPINAGLVQVSDPLLEALISVGGMATNNFVLNHLDLAKPKPAGTLFEGVLTTTSLTFLSGGAGTIFVSSVAMKFAQPTVYPSTANITVRLQFGSGSTHSIVSLVFAVTAATPIVINDIAEMDCIVFNNALGIGSNLTLVQSMAPTSGGIEYSIIGGNY